MESPPLSDLLACPQCDTLHKAAELRPGETAACQRCGITLMRSQPAAMARILSLSLTAFILMIMAVSFPFLDLDAQGQKSATSVIGAILAFKDGYAFPLALAVGAFIVVLPLTRLVAIIYAITPLVLGTRQRTYARGAFGLAEKLRPWSMAEIFLVGVSVALIKIAGLASVTVGPAFWAFVGLVLITVLKDQMICRYSIWEALDKTRI